MSVFHEFLNETKFYIYEDIQRSDYFGPLSSEEAKDQVNWAVIQNSIGVNYNNSKLGKINGALEYYKTDYFFKNFLEVSNDFKQFSRIQTAVSFWKLFI